MASNSSWPGTSPGITWTSGRSSMAKLWMSVVMGCHGYPLVNVCITMENHFFFGGKTHKKSMAMFNSYVTNYQRVHVLLPPSDLLCFLSMNHTHPSVIGVSCTQRFRTGGHPCKQRNIVEWAWSQQTVTLHQQKVYATSKRTSLRPHWNIDLWRSSPMVLVSCFFRISERLYPLVNWHHYRKSPCWMGKLAISTAMLNSNVTVNNRGWFAGAFRSDNWCTSKES